MNFFKGYVSFTVEGFFVERFLNIATHRNIYLWDIKRLGSQKARMKISRKGFGLLGEIAEKVQVKVKKTKEVGLPFWVEKYRKRTAFFIGGVFFFLFLFVMSFFLWHVDIEYMGDKARVQGELESAGLKLGMPMMSLDKDKIANKMMIGNEDYSMVIINLKGTTASVRIEERLDKPVIEDRTVPCNIVASKAGVISKINTKLGIANVQIGTAVAEGQVLVSGVVDSQTLGVRYLHAESDIEARTTIERSGTAPLFKEVVTRTKRTKAKHSLSMFGLNIPLYFSDKVSFTDYERYSEVKQANLGGKLYLPFALHYDKFWEVKKENVPITEDVAVEIAKNRIVEEMKKELSDGGQVLSENVTQGVSEAGEIVVTVSWECVERIGRQFTIYN